MARKINHEVFRVICLELPDTPHCQLHSNLPTVYSFLPKCRKNYPRCPNFFLIAKAMFLFDKRIFLVAKRCSFNAMALTVGELDRPDMKCGVGQGIVFRIKQLNSTSLRRELARFTEGKPDRLPVERQLSLSRCENGFSI